MVFCISICSEPHKSLDKSPGKSAEKCSRTFITFTDERILKINFPQKKVKAPLKQDCRVTRLPAKYFDPITQTPYM